MPKFIALYKAYSGGEWFDASLRSIMGTVDGIVVAMSKCPWMDSLRMKNDCADPLANFMHDHPDFPVRIVYGDWRHQEDQYQDGLTAIRKHFGDDSMVLIIDTDEVWEKECITQLHDAMTGGGAERYRCTIRTYVKSPLYQIYPIEWNQPMVGLQRPSVDKILGRFAQPREDTMMAVLTVPGARFHHFSYVRAHEVDLHAKFFNTSAQEYQASEANWFESVWGDLPFGENLHMTKGIAGYWNSIKVLTEKTLPLIQYPDLMPKYLESTQAQYRELVRARAPEHSLIPVPNDRDKDAYRSEILEYVDPGLYGAFVHRLKCTVLESLVLMECASDVAQGGTILEIGSGSGGSLAAMALASHAGVRLISIDPFAAYTEVTHAGTIEGVKEGNEDEFWKAADMFRYRPRVTSIKQNSDVVATDIPDASCGLVFVDGNHSYDIIKKDLELYWPKVKPGGVLLIHDYTTRFPGVVQAVDEWWVHDISIVPGTSIIKARKD